MTARTSALVTLLLVFLLRSWSQESAPAPPEGRFELAGTTSEDGRNPAVVVLVSTEAIWIEGHRVIALHPTASEELVTMKAPAYVYRGGKKQ